jgi:hypothetical protein
MRTNSINMFHHRSCTLGILSLHTMLGYLARASRTQPWHQTKEKPCHTFRIRRSTRTALGARKHKSLSGLFTQPFYGSWRPACCFSIRVWRMYWNVLHRNLLTNDCRENVEKMRPRIQIGFVLLPVTYIILLCVELFGCHPFQKHWQIYPDPGGERRVKHGSSLTVSC